MKTNIKIKDEPADCQVEKFIRLYSYSTTTATTKTNANQDLERKISSKGRIIQKFVGF